MELLQRKAYWVSVFGLTIFAFLSAGRDVVAKQLFTTARLNPVFATFFMSLVSWLVFYATASISGRKPYLFEDVVRASPAIRRLICYSNLLTLVGFLTAILSVDKTNAYVSALLDYGGSPIITVLLAIIILRENPSRGARTGLSISLVGVIVLVGGLVHTDDSAEQVRSSMLGATYAIVSAVAFGFNQIVNKKLINCGIVRDRLWLARLPLLILALGAYIAIDGAIPTPDSWLDLTLWAVAGTTVPLFLLVYAFEHMRVSNISSFLFLIPLFSFLGSLAYKHFEYLQIPLYSASGLLVLAGVLVTERSSCEPARGDARPT